MIANEMEKYQWENDVADFVNTSKMWENETIKLCKSLYFLQKDLFIYYWKVRSPEKKRYTERSFFHWFTKVAKARAEQNQEPGLPPDLSHGCWTPGLG